MMSYQEANRWLTSHMPMHRLDSQTARIGVISAAYTPVMSRSCTEQRGEKTNVVRQSRRNRQQHGTGFHRGIVFYSVLLLSFLVPTAAAAAGRSSSSVTTPYQILGVSSAATEEEIRKRYRTLCLLYHPDKNVDKSPEDRARVEEAFKKIQQANSQIGNKVSRRQYDSMASYSDEFGGDSRSGSFPYGSSASETFFRSFYGEQQPTKTRNYYYSPRRRTPFYFNGVDVSDLFSAAASRGGVFGSPSRSSANNDATKMMFVEHVTIPLEELYKGTEFKEFVLNDGVFQRYKAAFRGGMARQLALQGLLTSIPILLRTSWPVSAVIFVVTFHLSLPRPTKLFYATQIKKGWKGGTKIKFNALEPGFKAVFVLVEGKHKRYRRVGDDLITEVTIAKKSAKNGCDVLIEPLDERELPFMLKLHQGQITHDKQVITVKGRGWPTRNTNEKGDLLVTVRIVSDENARKRRARAQKRMRRKAWKL